MLLNHCFEHLYRQNLPEADFKEPVKKTLSAVRQKVAEMRGKGI